MSTDPLDELLHAPPFAAAEHTPAFLRAFERCLAVLRTGFPRYAEFLERRAQPVAAGPRSAWDAVRDLPALFLPVLKGIQFPLPENLPITVRLTSSGTTGRPSETPQDEPSWRRRVQAMRASYEALDLFPGDMDALAFLMDPATTRMAGSLVIDAVLRQVPRVRSVTYLARLGPSGPSFPAAEAVAALTRAAARGPVLLVGYPALIAAAVLALRQTGRQRLPLPAGSVVLTGGGWKSFLPGVTLAQDEFRAQAAAFFDVPPAAIRDMYGLSERPAVFVQCAHGRYHVPVFAWARAIDPETGADVPRGEVGLLQLTVPLTTSYPLLKILTTDRASLHDGCARGLAAAYLVPRGRVTAARFETCAMKIGQAVAGAEGRA